MLSSGSFVKDYFLVAGNPGYIKDEIGAKSYPCGVPISAFKIFWLLAELAFLYGIWVGSMWLNPKAEIATFDYMYWFLFGASCLLRSLLSSILLKYFSLDKAARKAEYFVALSYCRLGSRLPLSPYDSPVPTLCSQFASD